MDFADASHNCNGSDKSKTIKNYIKFDFPYPIFHCPLLRIRENMPSKINRMRIFRIGRITLGAFVTETDIDCTINLNFQEPNLNQTR